ncbi:MAG: metallophosphoesterase, partial [Maricaulaceae bacterium]
MTVYYAIGDIHGEITKLNILHSRIERTHEIDFPGQTYSLVHLGDYVDRGPDSFEVINKLIKLENGSP